MQSMPYDVGDTVTDPENDGAHAVVVGTPDARADEYTVEATGKTVTDHNPTEPADAPVVEVVYCDSDDAKQKLGVAEKDATLDHPDRSGSFAGRYESNLRALGTVYSHPATRLVAGWK